MILNSTPSPFKTADNSCTSNNFNSTDNLSIFDHLHIFQRNGLWLAVDTYSLALLNLENNLGPVVNLKVHGYTIPEIATKLNLPLGEVTNILVELAQNLHSFQQSRTWRTSELEPRTLILLVTQTCNLRCRYCYADAGTYSMEGPAVIELALAQKAMDLANTLGIESIQFFGGEPLLAIDLIKQIIAYCREKNYTFHFGINTNGTCIDSAVATYLAAENIAVTVSIDGPASVHNCCRVFPNGSGTLESALAGVELLQASNVPLRLQPVYSKRYIPLASIREIATFLSQYTHYFDLGYVTPVGNTVSPADIMTDEEVSVLLCDVVDFVFDAVENDIPIIEGNIYTIISSLFADTLKTRRYICDGLAGRLTVFTNGDIYTCHYAREAANCLGNLTNITPATLFSNREQVLEKFHIASLDFWTKNFGGFCIATLEENDNGQFKPRYPRATTEFYEHLLYRIATTDMPVFLEKLRDLVTRSF